MAHAEARAQAATHGPAHAAEGKLGVWLFLLTEVMLFGGLFILYVAYRTVHTAGFYEASHELDRVVGTANTAVLITSSLLVALGGLGAQRGRRRAAAAGLLAAAALGVVFLTVKAFEWGAKFAHGLFPGSPVLAAKDPGEILFFGLYFVMTGLHALHVLVGAGLLVWAATAVSRGRERAANLVEGTGLYWHLVDVIWVFLFPLLYLIG